MTVSRCVVVALTCVFGGVLGLAAQTPLTDLQRIEQAQALLGPLDARVTSTGRTNLKNIRTRLESLKGQLVLPPVPVDCALSAWTMASADPWSACTATKTQSRTETWTRTLVTPASNGGVACGSLIETRTGTQACTTPPPPTDPPSSATFVSRPRLLLTPTRLSTLRARKDANTAEYAGMKSYVDAWATAPIETSLTSATTTGGVGTTFTVADGSLFPTASHQIRIDTEILTVTRAGNTFTVVTRGDPYQDVSPISSHLSGVAVWKHVQTDFNGLLMSVGLLTQMGVTGYEQRGRYLLNEMATYFDPPSVKFGGNAIRWFGFHFALGFDWLYSHLTAVERALYVRIMAETAQYHLDNPKEGIGYFTDQYVLEAIMGNNIAGGQIRSVLAMAATTYGEAGNAAAQTQWNAEMVKINTWMKPGMLGGAFSAGVVVEGFEYMQTDWLQLVDIFNVLESAVNDTAVIAEVKPWMERMATFVLYATLPGTTNVHNQTTGTIAQGSTSLVVASASGFVVGDPITVYGALNTTIVAISGTTFTLREPAPATITNGYVMRQQMFHSLGDVETYANDNDFPITGGEPQIAVAGVQDLIQSSTTSLTGHLEYWLDHQAPSLPGYQKWKWFLAHPPSVTAVDYRSTLPLNYTTADPDAMGVLFGRASWSDPATAQVLFVAGQTFYDHATSYYNSYGFKRKGVWLTRHLAGYGANGITNVPFLNYPQSGVYSETPFVGASYHNTVWMNGHGPTNPYVSFAPNGRTPASLQRSTATDAYLYGRGDASGMYNHLAGMWTAMGHANNDARTFVRDFLWISPDIVVFHDRLTYANATTSPTTWFIQTPGNPTVTSQRLEMTHAGQKLVQDILLPTSAMFVEVNHAVDEDAFIQGFRTKVTSGVSASTEYGFHVLQGMDSGGSPSTVTTLTTTNANVAQIGSTFVVGFVKGTTPTLNITYTFTGTPTHYLFGFAPSTAYHVVNAGGTVTISPATGSGDTTSDRAGRLVVS